MVKISVIDDHESFEKMRDEWNLLLENSNHNVFFLKWEWLYYWWLEYRSSRTRLYIITARENDQLIAIAPLYLNHFLLVFREISFLGSNEVCSDHLDFIVRSGREKEVTHAIISHVVKNRNLWDVVNFNDIPSRSNTIKVLEQIVQEKGLLYNTKYNYCPYVRLENQNIIEDSYSPFIKSTLKRKRKKLNEIKGLHFTEEMSCDGLEKIFSSFIKLNSNRLKSKGIRSPFLSERFAAFHKQIYRELCKDENVLLTMLTLNNKMLGAIYLFVYNNCYLYYQSGFEKEYEMLSPGTLLLDHCIQRAHENGAREFDFLRGDEEYKGNWTKLKRKNVTISIYNNKIVEHILPVLHKAINKFNSMIECWNNKYIN